MAILFTNIFYCKTLQNLPKVVIFVWKHIPSGNPDTVELIQFCFLNEIKRSAWRQNASDILTIVKIRIDSFIGLELVLPIPDWFQTPIQFFLTEKKMFFAEFFFVRSCSTRNVHASRLSRIFELSSGANPAIVRYVQRQRSIINFTPRGKLWPPGVKLSPRGEIIPWGSNSLIAPPFF
jgi:hypothetical protein